MNTTESVDLSALAVAIARHLPGQWSAEPIHAEDAESNQHLTRADGLRFFFAGSRGGWAAKGKLLVSFSRPRANGSYIEVYENGSKLIDPEIGLSETKTPQQIAQSIVSRLLSNAETVFAKVAAQIRAYDDAERVKTETAAKIAEAIGAPARHTGSFWFRGFDFDVRGGDSVAINTYGTDRDTALAIIGFLKSRQTVAS